MRTLGCFLSPKYTQDWLRVKNKPDYWISKLRPGALTKKLFVSYVLDEMSLKKHTYYNRQNCQAKCIDKINETGAVLNNITCNEF